MFVPITWWVCGADGVKPVSRRQGGDGAAPGAGHTVGGMAAAVLTVAVRCTTVCTVEHNTENEVDYVIFTVKIPSTLAP